MAILGVLLGITICAVAWCIDALREHGKLTPRQDKFNLDVEARITALERRNRAHGSPAVGGTSQGDQVNANATQRVRAGRASVRTWNEDIGAAE